jgi:hypothetical protein
LFEVVPVFTVLSDSIDTKIPEGKCLVTGVVTREGENINEALIYCESGVRVNSNKIGRFRILIDTADTYLVFHKSPYQDAYMEGYKFENQHHIEVKIFMPTEIMMIEAEKPVIYAYADKETDVKIELNATGEMTFTYPQINKHNTWNFTTKSNGSLLFDNKEYPYIFWEAASNQIKYHIEDDKLVGDVIKSDMMVSFLEEKLTELGLNATEKTDFITYWGPRLTQKSYALLQFRIDVDYDEIATIAVTPQPENLRRVYLLFTPFDEFPTHLNIHSSTKTYPSLSRKGLTIVEWGGSQISEQQLNKQL